MTERPSSEPLQGEDLLALATILIAEYDVLRTEIGRYQDHQKQIMNFVFLIVAAMFSVAAAGIGTTGLNHTSAAHATAVVLLLLPPVFMLLACLYSDRTLRIIRLADYVHNHLRAKMMEATVERVWQWEVYKAHTQLFNRRLALALDKMRWLVFVLPSVVAIVLFTAIQHPALGLEVVILLVIDCIALVISIGVMFVTEETSGVRGRSDLDLDSADRAADASPDSSPAVASESLSGVALKSSSQRKD